MPFNQDEFENFFLGVEDSADFFDPPKRLVSGRIGYYYFNLRNFLNSRKTKRRLAEFIYAFCLEKGMRPQTFLGIPQAMTPIADAVNDLIDYHDDIPVPVLRTAPKGHGDPRDRASIGYLTRGNTAVMLEDTTTTGGSGIKYLADVQNAGIDVLGFVAVVDRMERRDGGLFVPEFFSRVMHVPYHSLTDASRLLPNMYARLKPPDHVVHGAEQYFREYCGRELALVK